MVVVPEPHRRVDVTVDGVARWYLMAEPPARAGIVRWPVVVDLHGHAEGAIRHATSTRFAQLGATEGFITVTPQGSGMIARWQLGDDTVDVQFLLDLIDPLAVAPDVDPERIYLTGMSNGGVMATALAATRPGHIATSGRSPESGTRRCRRRPTSCPPSSSTGRRTASSATPAASTRDGPGWTHHPSKRRWLRTRPATAVCFPRPSRRWRPT